MESLEKEKRDDREEQEEDDDEEEEEKEEQEEEKNWRSTRPPKRSKTERYLHMKEQRKQKRKEQKEKRKRKREALRAAGEPLPPPRPPVRLMADSSCRQRIAIDCSFDDLMSLKDTCKLLHQLNACYGLNRRAPNPTQLYVTGVSGKLSERFAALDNAGGANWDVHVRTEGLLDTFEAADVVYLSSESDDVLEALDDTKVYVIGGLVDHNHHKGHCFKVAKELNLATARLPIDRFVKLNSRHVLTVNHVFHILLLLTETQDWKKSLVSVIPQRKLGEVKEEVENGEGGKEEGKAEMEDCQVKNDEQEHKDQVDE